MRLSRYALVPFPDFQCMHTRTVKTTQGRVNCGSNGTVWQTVSDLCPGCVWEDKLMGATTNEDKTERERERERSKQLVALKSTLILSTTSHGARGWGLGLEYIGLNGNRQCGTNRTQLNL